MKNHSWIAVGLVRSTATSHRESTVVCLTESAETEIRWHLKVLHGRAMSSPQSAGEAEPSKMLVTSLHQRDGAGDTNDETYTATSMCCPNYLQPD